MEGRKEGLKEKQKRKLVDRKPEGPKLTRRKLLLGAAAGAVGLTGLGLLLKEGEYTVEDQIRNFEYENAEKNPLDEKLREDYTWLLSQWYEKYTFGLAKAEDLYSNTIFITDPNDILLKGNEENAGWAGDSIFINLTSFQFQKAYYGTDGKYVYPFVSLREVLTHEMTHFITQKREDEKSLEILGKKLGKNFDYIKGFRLYDSEGNVGLSVLDEAATEFIANYYQKFSGLEAGAPTYPEETQAIGKRSKIELIADTFQSYFHILGINVEELARLHALSDLDQLAKLFAGKTKKDFKDDLEKITYGLSIIEALNSLDHTALRRYREELK